MIVMVLAPNRPFLLREAIKHDLAEKFTGDTPAPFKRIIRKANLLDEKFEDEFLTNMGWKPCKLSKTEKHILKAADYLDLCYKCLDELEMGNTKVSHILVNGIRYTLALQLGVKVKEVVKQCLKEIVVDLAGLAPTHDKLVETIMVEFKSSIGTSLRISHSTIFKGR